LTNETENKVDNGTSPDDASLDCAVCPDVGKSCPNCPEFEPGPYNDNARANQLEKHYNDTVKFETALDSILETETAGSLLTIPGITEIVSEHFNNDVLDKMKSEFDNEHGENILFCAACEKPIDRTDTDETLRKIGDSWYCDDCSMNCEECGIPIFKQQWINGNPQWSDTYDHGVNFANPLDMYCQGICVDCFEKIPSCAYCGESYTDRDGFCDETGYGPCCRDRANKRRAEIGLDLLPETD